MIPFMPHSWEGAKCALDDAVAALNSDRLGWGEWTAGTPGASWTGPIGAELLPCINRPEGERGGLKVGNQLHGAQPRTGGAIGVRVLRGSDCLVIHLSPLGIGMGFWCGRSCVGRGITLPPLRIQFCAAALPNRAVDVNCPCCSLFRSQRSTYTGPA